MSERSAMRREMLVYIEQMLKELIVMAKKTDQPLLAYMMDMALVEANERRRICKVEK